jgi:pantoate--beta-alanine ligase
MKRQLVAERAAMSSVHVIKSPAEMAAWSDTARARGERIACVPTMGALHAGHVSLLTAAKKSADVVVLSIFVNPTQFGPNEDLARYPRDLVGDLAKAEGAGTAVAFVPDAKDMYPASAQTFIEVREVSKGLCGDRRPNHFVGVATVVAKLFNIVRPHVALFGEKDFQQLAVIRRMVADLNMSVEIVGQPTVREPDGLAMSSRNAYLSPVDRMRALAISRGLAKSRERYAAGLRNAEALVGTALDIIQPSVDRIDYLEIRDAETLATVGNIDRPAVILAAVYVGTTRLIDNARLG